MSTDDFEFKVGQQCSREGSSWGIHCALSGCEGCFDCALQAEGWDKDKLLGAARVWNYYGMWPGLNQVDYLTKEEVSSLPRPSFHEHHLNSHPRLYKRDERVKAWNECISATDQENSDG